jgi:quinone-modifying oxidoreductase subunit QmoB
MDKKYGVYICEGCGIGEALDVEALTAIADEEGLTAKSHPIMCSPEGVDFLKKEIDGGINTLVLCACSRRVMQDVFSFDGCIVDRVNLREGVVWSHPRSEFPALTEEEKEDDDNFDRVQMMAEDYLKMGMARVEKIKLPEPYKLEKFTNKILVIGGGLTGMSAALDAANAGYPVTIVEKEAKLGGAALTWRSQLPVAEPYESLVPPVVDAKVQAVEAHPNITVKTETVVARLAGQPGEFTVTLKKPGEKIEFDVPYPLPDEMKVDESGKELNAEQQFEAYQKYNEGRRDILKLDPSGEQYGAVVLAAGWRPASVEGETTAHLGYADNPDVITNAQFEAIAKAGKITRPSDGKAAKSVVFIQSPDKDENDCDFSYAGAVTSMVFSISTCGPRA